MGHIIQNDNYTNLRSSMNGSKNPRILAYLYSFTFFLPCPLLVRRDSLYIFIASLTLFHLVFARGTEKSKCDVFVFRFLATGDSYNTISASYRVGKTTVSTIVNETCRVLWKTLQPLYMPKPDRNQWDQSTHGFHTKWQFPNCLGALDGKHVQIFAPKNTGTMYFNYKKTFSVVLLALVDHNYSFSVIDVGSYGSNSDGGIFRRSILGQKLASSTLDIPGDKALPGAEKGDELPCVIVGDEAFPSLENLLRPFPGTNLADDERIFNYRLSRARRISENAFGILVNRWRLYHRKVPLQPENVDAVVKATCVLHNMLQKRGTPVPRPPQPTDEIYRIDDGILRQLERVGHRQKKDALGVRNAFKDYFMSNAGAVPWQHQLCLGREPE